MATAPWGRGGKVSSTTSPAACAARIDTATRARIWRLTVQRQTDAGQAKGRMTPSALDSPHGRNEDVALVAHRAEQVARLAMGRRQLAAQAAELQVHSPVEGETRPAPHQIQ